MEDLAFQMDRLSEVTTFRSENFAQDLPMDFIKPTAEAVS
jgi:hypothetical protein